jgi:hypothetical protein
MSYSSHTDLMTSQSWWGKPRIVSTIADTAAWSLGTISAFNHSTGPIFAFSIVAGAHPLAGDAFHGRSWPHPRIERTRSNLRESLEFAVASLVPPPPAPPSLARALPSLLPRHCPSLGRWQLTDLAEGCEQRSNVRGPKPQSLSSLGHSVASSRRRRCWPLWL